MSSSDSNDLLWEAHDPLGSSFQPPLALAIHVSLPSCTNTLLTFPGRHGTVICPENYLSTIFQVADVPVDKEKIAQSLNIKMAVEETEDIAHACAESELDGNDSSVSDTEFIVSDLHIEEAAKEADKALARQWFTGYFLRKSIYRLSKLLSTAKVYVEGLLLGRITKVNSNNRRTLWTEQQLSSA